MTVSIAHLQPIVALIAGILILIMPRLLNYIVAIYLIVVGIIAASIVLKLAQSRLRAQHACAGIFGRADGFRFGGSYLMMQPLIRPRSGRSPRCS